MGVTPLRATAIVWAIWAVSWAIAAVWSRRTVRRPRWLGGSAHYLPTVLGAALLFAPGFARQSRLARGWLWQREWLLPPSMGWLLCAATVASFAFAWWARLSLGPLWSGSVTRKEGHRVVDTGPYRLVRHPIYTGVIAASFLLAIEYGAPGAFLGAAVMMFGWWMKARVEERFLGEELGGAYEDYRRRTPMLIPFLRTARAPRR